MQRVQKTTLQSLVERMLWLSPFFFTLYLLRFKVAGIPFTALEVFIYLLFGLFFVGILLGQFKLNFKGLKWSYVFALLLFLGSLLGTLVAHKEMILPGWIHINPQMISLGILKGWVFAPVLYFIVLTQSIRDSLTLKKILLNFLYSGALVALISYFFALFGSGFAQDLRLIGFFESPNYLSLYLAPAFILSIYYLFDDLNKRERWLNLISFAIVGHTLLMTQSYGAILALFGAIGLYVLRLIIVNRQKSKKLFWGFVGMIAIFLVLILSQINSPKFQQFLDWENRSSTSVRLEIYEVSIGLIKEKTFFGVGPGLFQANYQTLGPNYLQGPPLEWNMPHPHNIFLAFWLNAGVLGFIAFLGLIIVAHRKFTYPLLAFWVILIHGLVDVPFWKNDLAMIFWLILGAILILQKEYSESINLTRNS